MFKYIFNIIGHIALNGSYFHMVALALNRFHAVFFVFSYQHIWKLRYNIIEYF